MLRASLNSILILVVGLSLFAHETSYAQSDSAGSFNGIFVSEPKVYDDVSLQIMLNGLKSRLGQLSGLDQSSLIGRIGSLQGASATQYGFSMQATGMPLPGVTTTSSQTNPSSQVTTGGTTLTPTTGNTTQVVVSPTGTTTTTTTTSTTPSNTSTNQTATSTPSSTSQIQLTTPTVTPAPSAQPSMPSYTMPSTFSPSASDILGEQMQLSYEIINLQMLLGGSLNDEYIKGTHFHKQHVTVGFPISITVPNKDYRNAVAEVEITICNPPEDLVGPDAPSLMTVLPREKTYNVAGLVSKSLSLGAGAVISGIINVGGGFLWGHETYNIVRDQDTVAIQRPPRDELCKPSKALTFAWQFRPVLGQKSLQDGLRQTYAQISFPNPYPSPCPGKNGTVFISTKWRKYDSNHIVGDEVQGSLQSPDKPYQIATFFQAPYVEGVKTVDNQDGSMTVTVLGKFLSGARVRIGAVFLDDSTPGFLNTLKDITFTASNQALAINGASVVNRDGMESKIVEPNPKAPEACVSPDNQKKAKENEERRVNNDEKKPMDVTAVSTPFSDALIQVTVPFQKMPKDPPGGPYPLMVILGGKAFGLSDAPFKAEPDANIIFLAPKDLVHNQRTLTVKKLFLWKDYEYSGHLPVQSDFAVANITVLSSDPDKAVAPVKKARVKKAVDKTTAVKKAPITKPADEKAADGKYTHFAITGTGLEGTKVIQPFSADVEVINGTMGLLTLASSQLEGVKQLVLQNGTEPPILVTVPDTKPSENKPKLQTNKAISPGTGVKYTIKGSMLESVTAVQYLGKQLPFALSLDKTSISITLPDEMTATPGIRSLSITYADGSSDRYTVSVGTPKS